VPPLQQAGREAADLLSGGLATGCSRLAGLAGSHRVAHAMDGVAGFAMGMGRAAWRWSRDAGRRLRPCLRAAARRCSRPAAGRPSCWAAGGRMRSALGSLREPRAPRCAPAASREGTPDTGPTRHAW